MKFKPHHRSAIVLLTTSMIWGFAFVAQKQGMNFIGPFLFNSVRFFLGSLTLLPVLVRIRKKSPGIFSFKELQGGIYASLILFAAVSLQQVGIVHTTAGKAGFITGLYLVFVPLIRVLSGKKSFLLHWAGVILAVVGLYFLSMVDTFRMATGDLLVLLSAFLFAVHILVIDNYSALCQPVSFSFIQFISCSILSFITSIFVESVSFDFPLGVIVPLLYSGMMSVGLGFTLQVVGQKNIHPVAASVILSLESVFAVLGGWILLDEKLTSRNLVGCALMLAGMIFANINSDNLKSQREP